MIAACKGWRSDLVVGVSPVFPPKHESVETAQEELLHLIARAPEQVGQSGSRWKLHTVQNACEWMQRLTLSGAWRALFKLGIHLKRARDYLHSPDPNYVEKLADIVQALELASSSQGRIVLLFSDEFTFYRQPSLSTNWGQAGANTQPLAHRCLRSNTCGRVVSTLNAVTGQTTSMVGSRIGVKQLVSFYQQVRATYADAQRIYLVEDNWPVHYHPDLIAALEPQLSRWERKIPESWKSEPRASAQRLCLPIQILPLPTYASWCNPIEKLWRWLKQEVIHLHRMADEWPKLKQAIKEFLDGFNEGSQELLRYVGLTPNSKLYGAVLAARAAPT